VELNEYLEEEAMKAAERDENNSDDDDDDNSGGYYSDGDNSDGDNGDDDYNSDNDNADENDNASDDNDNAAVVEVPAAPVEPPAPLAPVCSTPGQEMALTSDDGRIAVRVFGTMTQSLKFSIRIPVDPASVPPAPGPIVGNILFQLMAETCDGTPLATLPAEINLGVSYTDADAVGMNEGTFTLSWLDSSANRWNPALKQATDPPANYASATITDMGYYVLYQRS
jgi:hypothetical protein